MADGETAAGAGTAGQLGLWDVAQRLLQVVGAGAALVGWIVVVGGALVWARFEALGIPTPSRTVGEFPQTALLAEGLRALAVPLAVATVTAIGVYALARPRRPYTDREEVAWRHADARFGERWAQDARSFPGTAMYANYAARKDRQVRSLDVEALGALTATSGPVTWAQLKEHWRRLRAELGRWRWFFVPIGIAGVALLGWSFFVEDPGEQLERAFGGSTLLVGALVGAWLTIERNWRKQHERDHGGRLDILFDQGRFSVGAVVLTVTLFAVGLLVAFRVERGTVPLLTAGGFASIALWAAVLRSFRNYAAVAVATFTALVVTGGLVQMLKQLVDDRPELDRVEVDLKGGDKTLVGYLVARSGSEVLVARQDSETGKFAVTVVPSGQLEQVTVGPAVEIERADEVRRDPLSATEDSGVAEPPAIDLCGDPEGDDSCPLGD